jgi:hypothetical protein
VPTYLNIVNRACNITSDHLLGLRISSKQFDERFRPEIICFPQYKSLLMSENLNLTVSS